MLGVALATPPIAEPDASISRTVVSCSAVKLGLRPEAAGEPYGACPSTR
jgi:hypothetical protein